MNIMKKICKFICTINLTKQFKSMKVFFYSLLLLTGSLLAQTSSFVLYLPLNGNAYDYGVNNLNGSVYGATPIENRYGQSDGAMFFDGTDDYIEISNFGDYVPTKEITVSLWAKSYSSKGQFQLMLCPDNNRFAISINYYHANVNTNFWDFGYTGAGGNASGRLYYRPEPFDSEWHNYTFVSSISDSTMKMYKDNVLQNEESDPLPLINPEGRNLKIGSGDSAAYFYGCLDDIMILNRALSSSEIELLNYRSSTKSTQDPSVINLDKSDINNTDKKIQLKIYPNPTDNIINITNGEYSSDNKYQVKIIDSNSRILFQSCIDEPEFDIDISTLGLRGLYFIQILDEHSNLVDIRKVVVK